MAKEKSPHTIDEERCIIDATFKQIKGSNNTAEGSLQLTAVWTCIVQPQESRHVLAEIKANINVALDLDLQHLKRVRKVPGAEAARPVLQVVVCSKQLHSLEASIRREVFPKTLSMVSHFELVEVPVNPPTTRENMLEWSNAFWPLVWKGNPNNQYLSAVRLDTNREKENLRRVAQMVSTVAEGHVPVATMATDPTTNEVVAWAVDERCLSGNPLDHSIMKCIERVAAAEQSNRKEATDERERNYLCLGLHFYTTHEPCVMCAMALVHSRIGQLFFLRPSKTPGSLLDPALGIHQHRYLNWRYETWQWVNTAEDLVALVPDLGETEA